MISRNNTRAGNHAGPRKGVGVVSGLSPAPLRLALAAGAAAALVLCAASPAAAQELAIRSIRPTVNAGATAPVGITLDPPDGATSAVITENLPAGWTPSDISDGGVYDEEANRVTWTLNSNLRRVLFYQATAPAGAMGFSRFQGNAEYNGQGMTIRGDQIVVSGAAPGVIANRSITGGRVIDGGAMLSVSINVQVPADASLLLVDETLPDDWGIPQNINEGGNFINNSGADGTDAIRWGFLGIVPNAGGTLTLSYEVTAPLDDLGQFNFTGSTGVAVGAGEAMESIVGGPKRGFIRSARTTASALVGKVELDSTEEGGHDMNMNSSLDVGDAILLVNEGSR